MKIWRCLRTAAAVATLCSLSSLARSQDRPPAATQQGASHPSAEEKALLDSANRERAAAGVQLLHWDGVLAVAARQHDELAVREHLLSHQYPDELSLAERASRAGAKFSFIEENVAMGPDTQTIHDGWMHSPGHRKNMLNPEVSAVGIAVMKSGAELFAVQDFSKPVLDLSLAQQDQRVITLLKAAGLRGAVATEDARKTCGMETGYAGDHVSYVLHFQAIDLDKLPDELLHVIQSRAYRAAAVGACRDSDPAGFTRYRMAVLLH
ncbi:MAG: CAP domain-containing protein [Candidatus Acidiferrum sp.]